LIERHDDSHDEESKPSRTPRTISRPWTVRVFQGESPIAESASNRSWAQFIWMGFPRRPRHAQIEVALRHRRHGILHVSAKDLANGQGAKKFASKAPAASAIEVIACSMKPSCTPEEDREKAT